MRDFFAKQITSLIGSFIFLVLVDFALGSLTYFALQNRGIQSLDSAKIGVDEFTYVFLGNFGESVVALACFRAFRLYEHHLGKGHWKIIILLLQIYFASTLLEHSFFGSSRDYGFWADLFYLHPLESIYQSHILIATYLLYRFAQGEKGRKLQIKRQEVEILQLKQLKTKAELDALQAKINPHFLHNALNSIASLIHQDPDRAEQMVLLLSKFYRYSTGQKSDGHFACLDDELDMVATYLAVEQIRFAERLTYQLEVADEALRLAKIPRFLLQPLIENAIKHGLAKTVGPGPIKLRVWAENNLIHLEVSDSGPPFPDRPQMGHGLQSIQDRLHLIYGLQAHLTFENQPDKKVVITLPHLP